MPFENKRQLTYASIEDCPLLETLTPPPSAEGDSGLLFVDVPTAGKRA